jgi:site-specific recombinase XerD
VTVQKLTVLIADRPSSDPVFLNRCARPITRFGIHALVERYVCKIKITMPSLAAKRVSPHTIRHTTATPFFVLAWTSTQSVHGLDTSLSTRPMSTRRSIWR